MSKLPLLGGIALTVLAATGAALMTGSAAPAAPKPAPAAAPFSLPAPPANGEMGFVLDSFVWAVHQGKEDCPAGLAGTVRENFLETLPATERTRLLLKENEPELTRRWKASIFGPDNTNICANPDKFDGPSQRTVKGTVSEGFDMDHGQQACGHEEFTSPEGVKGIDNQAYRALGCSRNWRGIDGKGGDIKGFNLALATGEQTMVLLLRGVNSLKDDADVEVIWGSTDDRPVLDSKRNFIPGSSFTFNKARWRNVLHGQIHNGVLTTQPADVVLNRRIGHGGQRGQHLEHDLKQLRLRLVIQPDGTIKGLAGAYQTPANLIANSSLGGFGAAETAGIDCAAEYRTLVRLADGLKAPVTGKCGGVSVAYEVSGVPAFVNDLPQSVVAMGGAK